MVLVICRSPSNQLETIPRRNLLDRDSIAPRSRFDRTAIVEFFHELPTPSDWNPMLQRSSRRGADRAWPWPSDSNLMLQEASRRAADCTSRGRQTSEVQVGWTVSIARSTLATIIVHWRRIHAPKSSTWQQVSLRSHPLNLDFPHVLGLMIAWTQVHTIDTLRSGPPRSDVCRASTSSAKENCVGTKSHTEKESAFVAVT